LPFPYISIEFISSILFTKFGPTWFHFSINSVSMNQNNVVQFVCFVTSLETENFISLWKPYVKGSSNGPDDFVLQQAGEMLSVAKFKFISQHQCNSSDFNYAFMKGRSQMHFPEQKARIVQIGGYIPIQLQCAYNDINGDVKVMAFLDHRETKLDFYYEQTFHHLNIYEAYFENCAYSYVMEYFVQEQDAHVLVQQLKTRIDIEVALYKECKLQPV